MGGNRHYPWGNLGFSPQGIGGIGRPETIPEGWPKLPRFRLLKASLGGKNPGLVIPGGLPF